MHAELFTQPMVVARYRAGPLCRGSRALLKEAHAAEGYSRSTLERMAWVLLIVAHAVHRHGGSLSCRASWRPSLVGPSNGAPHGRGRHPYTLPTYFALRRGMAAQHGRPRCLKLGGYLGSPGR